MSQEGLDTWQVVAREMQRIRTSGQQFPARRGRDINDRSKSRSERSRSVMWALAVSLSLFGFQLTGALADSVGMESPQVLSLLLRFGTSLIFVVLLLQTGVRVREDITGLALAAAAMFLLLYSVHLIITTSYPAYPLSRAQIEYAAYFMTFALIPFVGTVNVHSQENLVFARNALLLITGTIVIVYWLSYSPDSSTNSRFRPYESVNPIGVGYAGLVAATLAAWILYRDHRAHGNSIRCAMYFMLASGAALSLMVGQRQVVLSGVLSILLFVFVTSGTRVHGIVRRVSLGILLGAIVSAVIYAGLAEQTLSRLSNTSVRIQGGDEARLEHWAEAIRLFQKSPISGGPIELPVAKTWPHNLLLESLMVTGVPGALLMLIFLSVVSILALRLIRFSTFGWIGLVYFQMTVSAMLSGALYANVWFWVSAGMTIGAYRIQLNSLKRLTRRSRRPPDKEVLPCVR